MNISNYISSKKLTLESHKLVGILRNCDGSKDALAFAPDMAFFVLGFKDLLQICKISDPHTEEDFTINRHCDEDSHHWLWYLEDLERLEKLNVKNTAQTKYGTSFARHIWSQENYKARLHTYCIAGLLINSKSSRERLVIIDCLEAAFAVFITALNHTSQKTDLFNTLRYFGKEHFDDEAGHDQGSWLDNTRTKKHVNNFNNQTEGCVDLIFNGFQALFTDWANTLIRHGISRETLPLEQLNLTAEPA